MLPINANLRRGLALTLLVLSVSACNKSERVDGTTTTAPPPVVVAPPAQEDKFGAVFGVAYRAAADGEPFVVQDGDLIPISLTTEPEVVN